MKRAAWGLMQSGDFPKPIAYWKFGENTGTTAKDSSPNGNDGTLHVPTWVTGHLGPGLSFDGVDDYVSVPHSSNLNIANEITLMAWVKLAQLNVQQSILWKKYESDWGNYILRVHPTNALWFTLNIVDVGFVDYTSGSVALDTWVQVVATYDGAFMRLYKNAVPETPQAQTGLIRTLGTDSLFIGQNGFNSDWFKGIIDEARIYNVALTASQIRELYLGYE